MISVILLFATISSGSVLMTACGKKYEEILPITGSALVLFLFLAGMMGKLKAGAMLLPFIVLALYIAALVLVIKKRNVKEFFGNLFTPGALIYVLLLGITLLAIYGKKMDNWDEFSHWGDVVKAMWLYNDFATNPVLGSTFQSYPPAMSLFQYYFEKITIWTKFGPFSEWRLYFAYQMFAFSFLMPFTREMKWKKAFVVFAGLVAIFLTPAIMYPDFYTSIYIDPFLGFLFGAGLLMILFREKCDRYYIVFMCSVCSMLVLAKAAGMLFAFILLVASVLDYLIDCWKEKNNEQSIKTTVLKLRYIVYIALAVIIPNALWKHSIQSHEAGETFTAPYDMKAILQAVIGKNETYQQKVWDKFWLTIYNTRVSLGNTNAGLNYFALPLVFLLLMVFVVRKKRALANDKKVNDIIAPIAAFGGAAIYIFGVVASYMCKFVEAEATSLASFQRYVNIVFLGIWILVVISFVVLASREEKEANMYALIMMVVLLIVSPMNTVNSYVTRAKTAESIEKRASYDKLTNKIMKYTEQGSSVYFVSQEDDGYDYWVTRFAIRPWSVVANWGWSIGEGPFYDGDYYTRVYDAPTWISELVFKYDYVALYQLNDYFYDTYSALFENPDDIKEGRVYKVDKDRFCLVLCK